MTVTVTKSPGRGVSAPAGTEKCTSRLSGARPDRRPRSAALEPESAVTSSSWRVPTSVAISSAEIRSCRATRRSKRSWTTALGTWWSISPAGVPGRMEYWKVNAEEKREASTTRIVSAKSSSVSPGKPTMMSVVMAACGMRSRTFSRIRRNFADR